VKKLVVGMVVLVVVGCGSSYKLYDFKKKSSKEGRVKILHLYKDIKNSWDKKLVGLYENSKGVYLISYKNFDSQQVQKQIDSGKSVSYSGNATYDIFGITTNFKKLNIKSSLDDIINKYNLKKLQCTRDYCYSPMHNLYFHINYSQLVANDNLHASITYSNSSKMKQEYMKALQIEKEQKQLEAKRALEAKQQKKSQHHSSSSSSGGGILASFLKIYLDGVKASSGSTNSNSSSSSGVEVKYNKYEDWNKQTSYSLYNNGKYEGLIIYTYDKGDDTYKIFNTGANSCSSTNGYYASDLSKLYTAKCGSTTGVSSLQEAVKLFGNCVCKGAY